ncbi:MAG TPA: response regulator [Steroidobacteraceae bacterium]|jgi:CheY-like chemotaxis protein
MNTKRVLIAEDNQDAADALAELLRMAGHEPYTARDGLEAVKYTQSFRPDCILLDIGMPLLDGLEAARHIRRLDLHWRPLIVATTGSGRAIDRVESEEAGIDVHLTKPIDLDAVLRVLEMAGSADVEMDVSLS